MCWEVEVGGEVNIEAGVIDNLVVYGRRRLE
jgi:hypothetical protein